MPPSERGADYCDGLSGGTIAFVKSPACEQAEPRSLEIPGRDDVSQSTRCNVLGILAPETGPGAIGSFDNRIAKGQLVGGSCRFNSRQRLHAADQLVKEGAGVW